MCLCVSLWLGRLQHRAQLPHPTPGALGSPVPACFQCLGELWTLDPVSAFCSRTGRAHGPQETKGTVFLGL